MPKEEIPRGQLSCVILSTLLEQDKYGYEIIDEVLKNSQGKISIKQPSLYSSLKRMEEQTLISSYWRDSDIGGKRHYYHLTDLGKKHLEKWQADYDDIYYVPQKQDAMLATSIQQTEINNQKNCEKFNSDYVRTQINTDNNIQSPLTSNYEQDNTTQNNTDINTIISQVQDIQHVISNQKQEETVKDDGVFITERLTPEDFPKQPRIEARRLEVYVSGNSVTPDLKRSKTANYEDRVKDLYEKSKANAENQELELIDSVVKFTTYKDLQNFYAQQNIKFKPYQKLLKKTERDYNMVRITKLNMLTWLIVFIYTTLLSIGFNIGFSFSNVARLNRPFVYMICPFIALAVFIISYIIYLKTPQKRIALDLKRFKINSKLVLISLLLLPIILALNIFIGFNFANFARYALTIIYPCVTALTYFISYLVRKVLLKTKIVY